MRKKIFLLAGGPGNGTRTGEQLKTALRNSGTEHPAIAYIGTASGDDRRFMKWFERPLLQAGAASLTMVPLVGAKADRTKALQVLQESDVIFLSGGEVEDGMEGLDPEIRRLLRKYLEEGKQFIGLSAGSIMQGRAWPHWDDEDTHPEEARLFDCLGFAHEIFDTHAENEGWPELRKAVALSENGFTGYGIPAGEMAVIDENGSLLPNDHLVRCENRNGEAVLL
jgi:peptidase E